MGARIGRLFERTRVRFIDDTTGNTKVRLEGWIHADSLTANPASIVIPGDFQHLTLEGDVTSTRFVGSIRNPSPTQKLSDFACFYRLVVFDHLGIHLHTQTFCLGSCLEDSIGGEWLAFDLTIPYPPSAFATYRIARGTGRGGMICIFK